jgi:hypothetical protein
MMRLRHLVLLLIGVVCSVRVAAQTEGTPAPGNSTTKENATQQANPWDFNASISGYLVPHGQSYASPTFTADRDTLHLEARYNSEAQRTGSLWGGYNLSWGKKLVLDLTPMIGGVFGDLNGIAPGMEFTGTYKKIQLYSANEYIFDTTAKSGDFFYTWTQLTCTPVKWFTFGYVLQRTKAYQSPHDIERGLLVGFIRKKMTFTTQVFNLGQTDPTAVLSLGCSF